MAGPGSREGRDGQWPAPASQLLRSPPQCPFHGKIIPRDDTGRPLHPEDRAREQKQKLQLQRPAGRPGRSGGRGSGSHGMGGALDPSSPQGGPWLPRVVACRLPLSHNSQAWPGHAVLGASRALSTSLAAFHAAPDGRRGRSHGRKPPCRRWFGFWVLKPLFKQMEKPRPEKLIG